MSKRLALAVAIALTAAGSVNAQTSQTQAWVARSNDDAKVLLDVIARFTPYPTMTTKSSTCSRIPTRAHAPPMPMHDPS
jgi:hypothetical protein